MERRLDRPGMGRRPWGAVGRYLVLELREYVARAAHRPIARCTRCRERAYPADSPDIRQCPWGGVGRASGCATVSYDELAGRTRNGGKQYECRPSRSLPSRLYGFVLW